MSKIRKLIANALYECCIEDEENDEKSAKLEQAIKAEIMGESRGEFDPEIGSWMKQSDLENLFKESEL